MPSGENNEKPYAEMFAEMVERGKMIERLFKIFSACVKQLPGGVAEKIEAEYEPYICRNTSYSTKGHQLHKLMDAMNIYRSPEAREKDRVKSKNYYYKHRDRINRQNLEYYHKNKKLKSE